MENNIPSENNDQEWERKDLHWRDERRRADDRMYQAKGVLLLMLLVVILIANTLLVSSFQVMISYTYAEPSAILSDYPDHTLLDSEAQEGMESFLLQAPTTRTLLLTMEKHFLFDRWQLVSEENAVDPITIIRGDSWSASVSAGKDNITDYSVSGIGLDSNMVGLPEMIPFNVLLYSGLLTALELGIWALLRKLRHM